jgi:hypothetical protein
MRQMNDSNFIAPNYGSSAVLAASDMTVTSWKHGISFEFSDNILFEAAFFKRIACKFFEKGIE